MSLLKLLAAGRSLIGTRAAQSPYRMRTENLLPKFESSKNPFAAKAKAEAQEQPKAGKPTTQPTGAAARPAKMETTSLFDAKPADVVAAPVKVADVQPVVVEQRAKAEAPKVLEASKAPAHEHSTVAAGKKRVAFGEWMNKLNPLKLLPAESEGRKKPSRAPREPVQAELSLEKVRVVRNDLSDADLEIMSAKRAILPESGGLPGAAGPMMSMTRTQTSSWNRLTSGVSGAIQTMIR
jgi:hypothetical protein